MEKMVEAEYPEYLYDNFYVAFVVFVFLPRSVISYYQ